MIATVDELRDHLGIQDHIAPAQLPLFRVVLGAAVADVEKYTGRRFTVVADDAEDEVRIFPSHDDCAYVDDFVGTPTLIERSVDHTTWTEFTSPVWFTPENATVVHLIHSRTCLGGWLRVTATFGFDAIPDDVKLATLMWGARLWKRRDSATGVEGFGEFGPVRVSRIDDPDVVTLLADWRRADRVFGIA